MIAATKPPKAKPAKAAKAPTQKKPPKPKPETIKIPRYVWEHKLECDKLAAEINADQIRFTEMKAAAMEVKASMNGKMVSLRQMMAKGPEHLPLIDGPKPAAPQPTTTTADADAWKKAPLRESLHKPGDEVLTKAINVLMKADITTIGKLEDLRASKGGEWKWHASVKGLGEEGAGKIEDAVGKWLDKHRDAKVIAEAKAGAAKKPDDVVPVHQPKAKKKAAKKKAKAK